MPWQGANLKQRQPTSSRKQSHPHSETVEAALNRLSKAYTTAMESIGVLHRLDSAATSDTLSSTGTHCQSNNNAALVGRVARTARRTLENAILSDPLVSTPQHAPSWTRAYINNNHNNNVQGLNNNLPRTAVVVQATSAVQLTSAGHQATVQKLAYLSLVNYGDLLLAGIPPSMTTATVLDRGVVRTLKSISSLSDAPSCWTTTTTSTATTAMDEVQESEPMTVRLALTAYMDATAIDGSDPTVWLKLACAARRLGRLLLPAHDDDDYDDDGCSNKKPSSSSSSSSSVVLRLKHRRLERHALERAVTALPAHEPPNRTAMRALDEWHCEDKGGKTDYYPPVIVESEDDEPSNKAAVIVLELTRYSWSTLGRMLLRAGREGSAYSTTNAIVPVGKNYNDEGRFLLATSNLTVSPLVQIRLSPLLVLPTAVLATVVSYLDPMHIWRFEATCRAMSASIISARALLDEYEDHGAATLRHGSKYSGSNTSNRSIDNHERNHQLENQAVGGENSKSELPEVTQAPLLPENEASVGEGTSERQHKTDNNMKRVSKRVRSQIITSGKRAVRSNRRNSTEYCLLAATLGCTADDVKYKSFLQENDEYGTARSNVATVDQVADSGALLGKSALQKQSKGERYASYKEDGLERLRSSSLSSFVENYSAHSAVSPLACLFRFVAHASLHVSQVFSCDPGGSLIMSSCLLDCIELMARRRIIGQDLVSSWSIAYQSVPKDAGLGRVEVFAIDLLHAELRLRKCDGEEFVGSDFDDDGNFVSTLIPSLLESLKDFNEYEKGKVSTEIWVSLEARCFWLAASLFFWRGRLSCNVGESREAEEEGLKWIEETRKHLQGGGSVPTPHLGSPRRKGQHWKELSAGTLAAFKDEIQASSIVLLAQEQFLEAKSKFTDSNIDRTLEELDFNALLSIGESLLERYACEIDAPGARHIELIDDFISVHGEKLLLTSIDGQRSQQENEDDMQCWFEGLFPVGRVENGAPLMRLSTPCILTIMATCLKTKVEHNYSILLLLVRLVIALVDLFEGLSSRQRIKERKNLSKSYDCFSDSDDEDSLSGDESTEDGMPGRNADYIRLTQYATLIRLLLTKIRSLYRIEITDAERISLARSSDFVSMLRHSLGFAADSFHYSTNETHQSGGGVVALRAAQALFKSVIAFSGSSQTWLQSLTRAYISGLIYIVITQRQALSVLARLKPSSNGRAGRIRATRKRADLVAAACCDAGLVFSQNLGKVTYGHLERSVLFSDPDSPPHATLALFCDALLWFWRAASSPEAAGNALEKNASDGAHLASYLDGFGRERLRVPIATAIIGLCGSASTTNRGNIHTAGDPDEQISLQEFYDSDASALDCLSSEKDTGVEIKKHEEILRVIMQAVHCVNQVFGKIDEREAVNFPYVDDYVSSVGPILPLVVARVLNNFALHLLVCFQRKDDDTGKAVWSDYPFGTRTVGVLLDSVLCKAYKCLHGFTLLCTSDAKDSVVHSTGVNSRQTQQFIPESEEAAAMLYRCIMRAYAQSRRSPPKAALEIVLAALPDIGESEKSVAIRRYLFSTDLSNIEMSGLVSLAVGHANWEDFEAIEGFDRMIDNRKDILDDEATVVRRGISRLIAQGPLPRFQDDEKDWRLCAAQAEEELSTKFSAIIDDLCFGDTKNCEGWFKASQCLSLKADTIADRLGLSKGFARNSKFYVMAKQGSGEASMDLAGVESMQEREAQLNDEGCAQCLGTDLSLFIRHSWSSFASLKECSAEVGKIYSELLESSEDGDPETLFSARVWHEINTLFVKKDFVRWQQAWGGIFVSSLRKAAYRCLSLALYTSSHNEVGTTTTDKLLRSEITESLGVSLYTELMGSQSYGYPLREMTQYRKREIAEAALACFERAVELVKLEDKSNQSGLVTWDLSLMIGKCREKIANTYQRESFLLALNDGVEATEKATRRYEHHMSLALQAYATSVAQAKEIEEEGGFPAEQHGGSSHGAVEAVYRLHASRLKCLISAVDRREDERERAELEALRLTECHWFTDPVDESDLTIRDRVWRVLVDVVGALAKCSLDNSYFHRSVYRHAQALMWSPVLYDPIGERAHGSLGTVSAMWACKVRGLNYATNAAFSAVSTISSLFTKKRPQLVAVWVTGDASSAFQAINLSTRKYDSLRGKYIAAYIDSLRLCHRRKELDTFLRWTSTCPRDLPSYFAASARTEGGKPPQTHVHDSLLLKSRSLTSCHFLTTVRRETNSALANVIVQDLNESTSRDADPKSVVERTKYVETQLKLAYACFLRLNCDPSELTKSRAWKYNRKNGAKDVVEALTTSFAKVFKDHSLSGARADWSGQSQLTTLFEAALRKCKELYPSLSGNYSFSKPQASRAPPKLKASEPTVGSKRKSTKQQVTKSFEVAVPEGLTEGATFLTSIKVGESLKKVRLTVPAGAASSLRFTLQVPVIEGEDERPSAKKKPRRLSS